MQRKIIVVGDPPVSGGRVLPYVGRSYTIRDHHVALIGGRAYCEGCNSVGIIAKAGGPRRIEFISEIALEGDVVICHCPAPQPLIATLQHTSTCDDMAGGECEFKLNMIGPGWFRHDATNMAASKRLVDSEVTHPPEAEQTENICPDMTNKEFSDKVLSLRDLAVDLIERRIRDLKEWGKPEQRRVANWFGLHDEALRRHLDAGLTATLHVLRGLTERNFVRYSEAAMRNVGCVPSGNVSGLAAEVCKPDLKSRTIAIGPEFCSLPDVSYRIDSKLSTLIHEVTHFDDTFSSNDIVYQMEQSQKHLASNPSAAQVNADSIVGYVLYGD